MAKGLKRLTRFIDKGEINEMEGQGLIQSFEYTYELAWTLMKDFFEDQRESDVMGSRDAFRLAFKRGLIEEGEVWMDMIKSRNLTSHVYAETTARHIVEDVCAHFHASFVAMPEHFIPLSERS